MNTLRKIYCRAFQKAFHIAIPFLPYRKPKIAGSVKELPEIIMRHKCTHVLIITDGGIMKLGLTRRLEKALKEAGIPYTIYDKTVANPTTVNVRDFDGTVIIVSHDRDFLDGLATKVYEFGGGGGNVGKRYDTAEENCYEISADGTVAA